MPHSSYIPPQLAQFSLSNPTPCGFPDRGVLGKFIAQRSTCTETYVSPFKAL